MFFTSAQFLTALNQLKLINGMTGSYVQPTVNFTEFTQPFNSPTHPIYPVSPEIPEWLSSLDHPIDF